MKKVPTATCALRDRQIVSIERVYTPITSYMKSAVPNGSDLSRKNCMPPIFIPYHPECILEKKFLLIFDDSTVKEGGIKKFH